MRFRPLVLPLLGLGLVHCAAHAPSPAARAATATASATPGAVPSAPEARPPSPPPAAPEPPPVPAPPKVELPRGGRAIFPDHRLVGYCGTPGAPALGRLAGNLGERAKTIESYAAKYGQEKKPLPVFELIAVVVQGYPGADGKSRRRVPESVVDDYLQAARKAKALLVLNVQPGHSDMITEAKAFEKYLKEPDVGLALDPEWQVKGKQKPGSVYGQTTGAEINEVSKYLGSLVTAGDLPEKLLVFHQVNNHVVKDEAAITAQPGVVIVKSVDGLGPKGAKIATYDHLMKTMPKHVHAGFKLFFEEDTAHGGPLMTPAEVLALKPQPEYVMVE